MNAGNQPVFAGRAPRRLVPARGRRDGEEHNLSWNCGEEGETQNQKVNSLRDRQVRNMMVALLTSQGVPMVLMGDEYGHTKYGNNNTYCHDSGESHLSIA